MRRQAVPDARLDGLRAAVSSASAPADSSLSRGARTNVITANSTAMAATTHVALEEQGTALTAVHAFGVERSVAVIPTQ